MNRQIKFRGQNIKGEWHYGFLSHNKDISSDYEWFISNKAGKPFAFGVVEKSIGQFTGLHDKNGKEIYEGDIVTDGVGKYKIIYDLKLAGYQPYCIFRDDPENYCEVIGNIYENTELLEKKFAD